MKLRLDMITSTTQIDLRELADLLAFDEGKSPSKAKPKPKSKRTKCPIRSPSNIHKHRSQPRMKQS